MTDEQMRPVANPSRSLRHHVTGRVERLQSAYLVEGSGSSEARGQLARLRRALGAAGGADPRTWSIVLDGLPPDLQHAGGGTLARPTRVEVVLLTTLTTYAVHQQGQTDKMHRRGISLGRATQRLARHRASEPGGTDDPTIDRLHRVSMAQTPELRAQALRALIQLMRGDGVALDYGQLAEDLFWLEDPRHATKVHLRWARDLYRHVPKEEHEGGPASGSTDDPSTPDPSDSTDEGALS